MHHTISYIIYYTISYISYIIHIIYHTISYIILYDTSYTNTASFDRLGYGSAQFSPDDTLITACAYNDNGMVIGGGVCFMFDTATCIMLCRVTPNNLGVWCMVYCVWCMVYAVW